MIVQRLQLGGRGADALDPGDVTIAMAALWESLAAELAAMVGPTFIFWLSEMLAERVATAGRVPAPAIPKQRSGAVQTPQKRSRSPEARRAEPTVHAQWQQAATFRDPEANPKASEVQDHFERFCGAYGLDKGKQWRNGLKDHLVDIAGFERVETGRNVHYAGLGLKPIGGKFSVVK